MIEPWIEAIRQLKASQADWQSLRRKNNMTDGRSRFLSRAPQNCREIIPIVGCSILV
jgi:hypothetical protein